MPAPSATATAADSLKTLLSVLKIRKLITVEDQRSTATLPQEVEDPIFFITYCRRAPEAVSAMPEFETFDFSDSFDTEEVRTIWEQMSVERRTEIWAGVPEAIKRELFEPAVADGAEPLEEGKQDVPASRVLKGFIEGLGCEFRELSLGEWNREEAAILASVGAEPTLFLFDLDLSRDGGTDKEGAVLLKKTLAVPGAMCGLITHQAVVGAERGIAAELSRDFEIPPDRLLVLSKEHLSAEPPNLEQLATDLRAVALSERCAEVKEAVSNILRTACEGALGELNTLSPHSFEQIVFTSSRAEGVWEFDTLFRVFVVLMGKRARRALRLEPALRQTVKRVREVNSVPKPVGTTEEARKIHADEIYESPELLNGSHSPLDLGDIFKISVKGNDRHYILLSQSCDLMLRRDGKRARDMDKVPLVLVRVRSILSDKSDQSQFVSLPFFDPPTGTEFFAHLAEVIHIDPSVLDLCTMNEDGSAKINLSVAIGDLPLESQRERAKILRGIYEKRHRSLASLGSIAGVPADEKILMAFEGIGWGAKTPPSITGQEIQYSIVRMKRLNQPRSGDLLLRFAQHHSRHAFEHDLDRGGIS